MAHPYINHLGPLLPVLLVLADFYLFMTAVILQTWNFRTSRISLHTSNVFELRGHSTQCGASNSMPNFSPSNIKTNLFSSSWANTRFSSFVFIYFYISFSSLYSSNPSYTVLTLSLQLTATFSLIISVTHIYMNKCVTTSYSVCLLLLAYVFLWLTTLY